MNTFRRIISAVLLLISMSILSACGNDDVKEVDRLDGAPDPDKIVSETITYEQWRDAFDFESVTNASVRFYREIHDSELTIIETHVFKVDGDKTYSKQRARGEDEMIGYGLKVDDETYYSYIYEKRLNGWYKAYGVDMPDVMLTFAEIMGDELSFEDDGEKELPQLYEKFSFSDGAYIAELDMYSSYVEEDEPWAIVPAKVTVKIVDGSFLYYEVTAESGGVKIIQSVEVFDVGTTQLTLPDTKFDATQYQQQEW